MKDRASLLIIMLNLLVWYLLHLPTIIAAILLGIVMIINLYVVAIPMIIFGVTDFKTTFAVLKKFLWRLQNLF